MVTAKDRKRQAREAGVCYKCGEAGHQAKRCKKRKETAKAEGEAVDAVEGAKDETMKEEGVNGHSKAGKGGAKTAKVNKSAMNGNAAAASRKRDSSHAEQQSERPQKAGKKAQLADTDAPAAVNGAATQAVAGKRKRDDKPQQQLSKREKRELAEESRFEAMVSDYKKKFLDVDQAAVSKDGGAAAKGEQGKSAPKNRWFDIEDV